MELDLEELAALFELLDGADFTEFRLDRGDLHILVRRGPLGFESALPAGSAAVQAPAATPAAPTSPHAARPTVSSPPVPATNGSPITAQVSTPGAPDESLVIVRSPILGTAYRAPRPGEPEFVAVGDLVDPETVLCIVEVMKLMSSVPAGVHGEIIEIYVKDGDLIEVDHPLFGIRRLA